MAALVETVRQARPETFGNMLERIFAMREAQKLAAQGPPP